MLGRIIGMCGTVFFAFVPSSFGRILTVEVPADVEREDVLNPTAEVSARLDALAHEETARHPAYAEFSTRGLS
jgi:hypothetical protein